MSKHITKDCFYNLPSGNTVHPCRLIHKDGTLMWKHAVLHLGELFIPNEHAHEAHIIKTAQRLEELNSWVSQGLDPWECFQISAWYFPFVEELAQGYCVYFKHHIHDTNEIYNCLMPHIQDHESLELRNNYLFFRRC